MPFHSLKKNENILIIDRQIVVGIGIKHLAIHLFNNFHYAATASQGIKAAITVKPELIVCDINLPDNDNGAIIRTLRTQLPSSKILVYTNMQDDPHIIELLKNSINGYVIKDQSQREIVKALENLSKGFDYYCEAARTHIIRKFTANDETCAPPKYINKVKFSGREVDLIRLICKQKNTFEISEALKLTERTVEQYRCNLTKKTSSKNVLGIMKFALVHQLISLDEL